MSLSKTVLENGYCIGCGICAAVADSPYSIRRNAYGMNEAFVPTGVSAVEPQGLEQVCPFGDGAPNETQLAAEVFPRAPFQKKYLGRYFETFAGHVADDEQRSKSSSGGVGRWLAKELLNTGKVRGVVQVNSTPNAQGQDLFRYEILTDAAQVEKAARSAYYATSLDQVLKQVSTLEGEFLFTGVPCFIKGLRLLARRDPVLAKKVKYTVGIVCGHMKTGAYAELIGWQLGIAPGKLESIDFRGKTEGVKASIKANIVRSGDVTATGLSKDLFGTNYSFGLLKPKACEFCDDVLAETADISLGDAWLPQYVHDPKGTSIIIVRNAELLAIVRQGIAEGRLTLDTLKPADVVLSQKSGLRHRNEGLEYRLQMLKDEEAWMPTKRVRPNLFTPFRGRWGLYKLRYQMSMESHEAFLQAKKAGSLDDFIKRMKPLVKKHSAMYYKTGVWGRVWDKAFSTVKKVLRLKGSKRGKK